MAADEQPDAYGHILKAALTSPPGTYSYEPTGDRFTDCAACDAPWDDCEASQSYADEEDPACWDACEHAWVVPPPTYTIVNGVAYSVLSQRGAPLYLEMPMPRSALSSVKFFQFDAPEDPPTPILEGGPWRAVDVLNAPFAPWRQ